MSLPTPKLMEWLVDGARTAEELDSVVGRSKMTDRMIAVHAAASPNTLSKLLRSADRETRAGVAANPNTSLDGYVELACDFPGEFLKNPLLDILLLERPFFWTEIRIGKLFVNARSADCPDSFWVWVTSQADWDRILNKMDYELGGIYEDLRGPYWAGISENVLDMVKNELYVSVFESSSISRVVNNFIGHSNPLVRRKIAENEYASIETLNILARDTDAGVRRAVALNPQISESCMQLLATDVDSAVRCAIALNQKTPDLLAMSLIEEAANSREFAIRIHVAENVRTPDKILETLARDSAWQVRWAVARNPHVPDDILPALEGEQREAINGLMETLDREEIYDRYGFEVLEAVAKNERTSDDILHHLAFYLEHGVEVDIAEVIAANAAADLGTLYVLADYDHKAVKIAVARNPSAPVNLLKTLSWDADVARVAKRELARRVGGG